MSNARDKANIPALNFSSTGIDDNATSTAITIDSSENVGIGTTSTQGRLLIRTNTSGFTSDASLISSGQISFSNSSGGTALPTIMGRSDNNGGLQLMGATSNAPSNADLFFDIRENDNTDYATTTGYGFRFSRYGTELMRLTRDGKLGIGTSSPSSLLHLSSASPQLSFTETDQSNKQYRIGSFGGAYAVYDVSNGQYRHIIDTNGNHIFNEGSQDCDFRVESNNNANMLFVDGGNDRVGIGTNSPDRLLHVKSTGNTRAKIEAGTTSTFGQLYIGTENQFIIGYGSTHSVADALSFKNLNASGTIRFYNNGDNERMRIDSSGNIGIGTTSPSSYYTNQLVIDIGSDNQNGMTIVSENTKNGMISFADGTSAEDRYRGYINYNHNSNFFQFGTDATERMRIDSSGNVFVAKTSTDLSVAGVALPALGYIQSTISNSNVIYANRLSTDGDVYRIYQDTTQEGSISVSGSTVSYNSFTGSHWSRFTDNSKPTILRGTVLETLDEMCDWYNLEFNVVTQNEDNNDVIIPQKIPHVLTDGQSVGDTVTYNHEGTDYQATIVKEADMKHMKSKVSDTVDAKNVYGVFNAYDEDGEGYNDFYVASVGSFVVRIKANETIAKGDLLQSNGDGTAKVQTDDNVKSSSFAKVLSTTIIETYEDGSYLVPCSLMC